MSFAGEPPDAAGANDARHLRRVSLGRLGPNGRWWGKWRREVCGEAGADMEVESGRGRRRQKARRELHRAAALGFFGWVGFGSVGARTERVE